MSNIYAVLTGPESRSLSRRRSPLFQPIQTKRFSKTKEDEIISPEPESGSTDATSRSTARVWIILIPRAEKVELDRLIRNAVRAISMDPPAPILIQRGSGRMARYAASELSRILPKATDTLEPLPVDRHLSQTDVQRDAHRLPGVTLVYLLHERPRTRTTSAGNIVRALRAATQPESGDPPLRFVQYSGGHISGADIPT